MICPTMCSQEMSELGFRRRSFWVQSALTPQTTSLFIVLTTLVQLVQSPRPDEHFFEG